MYCLSLLKEFHIAKEAETVKTPAYILEALRYYDEHFAEKITAQELAERIGVSRTTLMTGFRRYIGIPMHQYQQKLRLKQAEDLRKQGLSVVQAAEASGFSDVGGYIRAHRQLYGVTPTGRK